MVHIAIHEALNGVQVNWLEKVSDDDMAPRSPDRGFLRGQSQAQPERFHGRHC
jgi:hypothetical protein